MEPKEAAAILRKIVGGTPRDRNSAPGNAFSAGLEYATCPPGFRATIDVTLSAARLDRVARAVLVDGEDLPAVGRRLANYKTDQQARAYAIGQMLAALHLMHWHRTGRRAELHQVGLARAVIKRKQDETAAAAQASTH